MIKALAQHLSTTLPFLKEGRLLIAISGGVDSVVLTHALHALKYPIALAHCNFNLRGEESDADEAFVVALAESLGVEVFIQKFDTLGYAQTHKLSTQMAARALRYQWFNALCEQLHYDFVLTAHHADDNLETFLINLSRGTGIEGLSGIPQMNDFVVRPLLPFSRAQIETYAQENKLSWREDSSNASTKYLRNQLRHEVIPQLKGLNATFLQNFQKTQTYLQESESIIQDRVDEVFNQVVDKISEDVIFFNIEKIQALSRPKAYLYHMLSPYGFTEWNDVVNLLTAQSGKQVLSKNYTLLKDRDCIMLSKNKANSVTSIIQIKEAQHSVETPLGRLLFEDVKNMGPSASNTIYIDKDLLKYPLSVRLWQKGDYFYPFGMQGKKKVSKYLKDEKLSLLEKERIFVLCSNNNIVWVVNRRTDDRYKVTQQTKQVLKIQLQYV
ncbi:potassium ABC transporter ATPase [Mangrovimonas yunxiaonensis]|uniref:tRNA(Ile)-lysidine synthase n=1 Tax=Mangrovimonas yunxiaonensis TaxID=1197477 RepID=A0A084TJW7_9FLAO|nr:tRNA lysidine(34) synthetase TilS [Mangrovimonas yunxiaonensis]KFB01003.1 potassium ABC transporter ATPase [Mangrovimonas yunxiaonensis]GGH43088.1 tRNA(Ile)-lysidine synthase [Mangrovimonas yunxiaonensis]